jgi:hypothetical protein
VARESRNSSANVQCVQIMEMRLKLVGNGFFLLMIAPFLGVLTYTHTHDGISSEPSHPLLAL